MLGGGTLINPNIFQIKTVRRDFMDEAHVRFRLRDSSYASLARLVFLIGSQSWIQYFTECAKKSTKIGRCPNSPRMAALEDLR